MNKQTEALKMAIDWIEKETRSQYTYVDILKACKEALEQTTQEPVAWINESEDIVTSNEEFTVGWTPLYTHPAPSWQGLSDDERHEVIVKHVAVDCTCDPYEFARAIEAKLKEKNT